MRAILFWAGLLAAQDLTEQSRLGKQAMAERRYADAAAIYQKMSAAMPENAGLRLNVGLALFSLGDLPGSVAALEKCTQLDRSMEPAWLLLGLAFQKQGQPTLAIGPLRQALQLNPQDSTARFELGDAYLTTKQTQLAKEQFEALTRQDPRHAKALLGLGIACLELYAGAIRAQRYLEQKRWADAFVLYRKALAESPSSPGSHAAVARIYRETGHPDWARSEAALEKNGPSAADQVAGIERRLRQLGDHAELHEFLARLKQTQGGRAEAAQEWKLAARLAPGDRRIEGQMARALWRNREYGEALPVLEKLLREDPVSPDWNYLYGDLLYREEQSEKALPHLETAVRRDPGNLAAQAVLGEVYMQLDRTAAAIPHLEAALPSDEDGSLHYQLGLAYRRAGRPDEARAMFERQRALVGRAVASAPEITAPAGR